MLLHRKSKFSKSISNTQSPETLLEACKSSALHTISVVTLQMYALSTDVTVGDEYSEKVLLCYLFTTSTTAIPSLSLLHYSLPLFYY